jgi:hypothetical protein
MIVSFLFRMSVKLLLREEITRVYCGSLEAGKGGDSNSSNMKKGT